MPGCSNRCMGDGSANVESWSPGAHTSGSESSSEVSSRVSWSMLGTYRSCRRGHRLMRGLLEPRTLFEFFRGFVAYGGADGGSTFKIIAQWHQFHGVQKAVVSWDQTLRTTRDIIAAPQGDGREAQAAVGG